MGLSKFTEKRLTATKTHNGKLLAVHSIPTVNTRFEVRLDGEVVGTSHYNFEGALDAFDDAYAREQQEVAEPQNGETPGAEVEPATDGKKKNTNKE